MNAGRNHQVSRDCIGSNLFKSLHVRVCILLSLQPFGPWTHSRDLLDAMYNFNAELWLSDREVLLLCPVL